MKKWMKLLILTMIVTVMISVPASAKTKKVAAPKVQITDQYIVKNKKEALKVCLKWYKVKKAKKYTIKVYSGKKCISTKTTKKTEYSVYIPKKHKKNLKIKVYANNSKECTKNITRECWHAYEDGGYILGEGYWREYCVYCGHTEIFREGDCDYEE